MTGERARRAAAWMLLACALSAMAGMPAAARGAVLPADGAAPFDPDAEVLSLFIAPLSGADCMLLGMNGEWLLVDMGKLSDADAIMAMLDGAGVQKIDIALNTHPHSDHVGSMALLAGKYEIGRFLTAYPPDINVPGVFQIQTLRALRALGVPVETVADGGAFSFGKAEVRIMRQEGANVNYSSAVLRVVYGKTAFVLAADVTRLAQGRLAARYDLRADVLKYPHHGQEVLDPAFLRSVSPAIAVITNGSVQTGDAQKMLNKNGIPYYFTTWGMVVIQSDGERVLHAQQLTPNGLTYRDQWIAEGRVGYP